MIVDQLDKMTLKQTKDHDKAFIYLVEIVEDSLANYFSSTTAFSSRIIFSLGFLRRSNF